MSKPKRSISLQAELDHLATLDDVGIDIVDIPEAPAESWMNAKRVTVMLNLLQHPPFPGSSGLGGGVDPETSSG